MEVSIIIPVFNSQEFLDRCIQSVLAQTFRSFEVLLINDGSTDKSGKICDFYAATDKRIKVFHVKNGGVSAARNLGLEKAKCEYVAFIDSDDSVHSEYIGELYHTAKAMDSDIVCSGYTYTDKILKYEHNDFIDLENTRESFVEHLLQNTGGTICSKLFKESVISAHKLRFDGTLRMREDLIFALQFAFLANSFHSIQNFYYYYNGLNEDSLSKRDNTEGRLQVRNIISQLLQQHNFNRDIHERVLDRSNKEILLAGIKEKLKVADTLKNLKAFYRNDQIREIIAQAKISGLKETIIYTPVKLRSPIFTYLIYKIVYGSK